jgi:polysaccharide pyruvyl transferase WcaK-like protein
MAFAAPALAEVECTRKLATVAPGVERFALVNVSGLLSEPGQLSSYEAVVRHLRETGLATLVVPHVSRPGIDDISAGRALFSEFAGDSGVMVVDTLWSPAEIRSLTRRAQLVVTGRMHLGILALSQGTPALIVDSKGKVPGLLGLFGRPEWCIASHADLQARAPELIDAILAEEELREQLLVTASRVRVLAEKNFEGLGEGPLTPHGERVPGGASTPDAARCPSRSAHSA